MVSTVEAIIITQAPIAIGVIVGAYLLWDTKRELIRVLEKLAERERKR